MCMHMPYPLDIPRISCMHTSCGYIYRIKFATWEEGNYDDLTGREQVTQVDEADGCH